MRAGFAILAVLVLGSTPARADSAGGVVIGRSPEPQPHRVGVDPDVVPAGRRGPEFDPRRDTFEGARDSLEAGVFGGAAAISDRFDWGEARYAIAGVTVRYARRLGRVHVGAAATHASALRYALDEPSFEQFGWTASRFDATYLGGVFGYDAPIFGLEVTAGALVGVTRSTTRDLLFRGSGSLALRMGRLDVVAVVLHYGSKDAWLSDRTLSGTTLVHHGPRWHVALGTMIAMTMAPALLADPSEGPRIGLGRDEHGLGTVFDAVAIRAELGGRIRSTYLGAEVTFLGQLPIARVVVRQGFGDSPAPR